MLNVLNPRANINAILQKFRLNVGICGCCRRTEMNMSYSFFILAIPAQSMLNMRRMYRRHKPSATNCRYVCWQLWPWTIITVREMLHAPQWFQIYYFHVLSNTQIQGNAWSIRGWWTDAARHPHTILTSVIDLLRGLWPCFQHFFGLESKVKFLGFWVDWDFIIHWFVGWTLTLLSVLFWPRKQSRISWVLGQVGLHHWLIDCS